MNFSSQTKRRLFPQVVAKRHVTIFNKRYSSMKPYTLSPVLQRKLARIDSRLRYFPSGKSLLYISYHLDQQHEVKLLKQFLDLAGFDCLGDWVLAGKTGQELSEKRRNIIAGSSLFVAFITPQ